MGSSGAGTVQGKQCQGGGQRPGRKKVPSECWSIEIKEGVLHRGMEVKFTRTHFEEGSREGEQLEKHLFKDLHPCFRLTFGDDRVYVCVWGGGKIFFSIIFCQSLYFPFHYSGCAGELVPEEAFESGTLRECFWQALSVGMARS